MGTITICLIIVIVIGIIAMTIGHLLENDWLSTIGTIAFLLGLLSLAAYTLCGYLYQFQ